MITATLDPDSRLRVRFIPMRDYYDSVLWAQAVERSVKASAGQGSRIALIGHFKAASSYYLELFPGFTYVEAGAQGDFASTELRRLFYEGGAPNLATALDRVPASLRDTFTEWLRSPEFVQMQEEHLAIQKSRKTWGSGPFITLDALVQACGHILLVRRGRCPGKDLWAIPGGFLEPEERLLAGALRELEEETGLALKQRPTGYLLKAVAVFDHPDRSQRGRVITHAHHFLLNASGLPEVAGSDDAAEARWVPIAELEAMENQFFDDHFHILDHFLSILDS